MEDSIEEDIKILEEFIKYYEAEATSRKFRGTLSIRVDEDDIDALENLINIYKRVLKENAELKAKLEYKQYGDLDNIEFEKYINDIVETKTKELKEENEKLKYKYAEYVKFSIRKIEEMMDEEG